MTFSDVDIMAKHIGASFKSDVVEKKMQELDLRIAVTGKGGPEQAGAANARKLAVHYFKHSLCTMQVSPSPLTPDAFKQLAASAVKKAKK